MNIAYIIPTIGRPSLWPLAEAILKQISDFDQLIIGSDGINLYNKIMHDERVFFFKTDRSANGGSFQRNKAIQLLKSTHVLFLDDDDSIEHGAVETIKSIISTNQDSPHLFRCNHEDSYVWKTKELTQGNVSTQCICFPTKILGYWSSRYESDFDFIKSTIEKYPQQEKSIIWRDEIIATHNY